MPDIAVSPVHWSSLEDIDATAPLDESDARCLVAVRAVLEMHGKLDRFGLALLQSGHGENAKAIPLEQADTQNRVMQLTSNTGQQTGTLWKLGHARPEPLDWRRKYCRREILKDHYLITSRNTDGR